MKGIRFGIVLLISAAFILQDVDSRKVQHIQHKSRLSSLEPEIVEVSHPEIKATELGDLIYGLKDDVIPEEYLLSFSFSLDANYYAGVVEITVSTKTPQSRIVLHAGSRCLVQTALIIDGDKTEIPTKIQINKEHGILVLTPTSGSQTPKRFKILITFGGIFEQNVHSDGVYKSTFVLADKSLQSVISTHFEPSDARMAFPCFDEPFLKSIFRVVVSVPLNEKHSTILSNMPEEGDKDAFVAFASRTQFMLSHNNMLQSFFSTESSKLYVFQPTPKMSSYLLAWVIGKFAMIESVAEIQGKKIPVRCFGEEKYSKFMKSALDASVESLITFSNLFSIPYTLPKLDMVAIPNFVSGAMENWGLVTYNRNSFYFGEGDSQDNLHSVVETVFHENAHQWFGNLVTLKHWNELYLNEGFARYMQTIALENKFPAWAVFKTGVMERAKDADSFVSAHAVGKTAGAKGQVTQDMFSSISYDKGASILFMLNHFILRKEKNSFILGVRKYLKDNSEANADANALWSAISSEFGYNVAPMMETWTQHSGFPKVSVTFNSETCSLLLSQSRFQYGSTVESDQIWKFPIFFAFKYANNENHFLRIFMNQKTREITCGDISSKVTSPACCFSSDQMKYIKVNWKQTGFFRVLYGNDKDKDLLNRLISNFQDIPFVDRAGVVLDLFALNRADSVVTPISTVLNAVTKLYQLHDASYIEWNHLLGRLIWIDRLISDPAIKEQFRQNFLNKLVSTLSKSIQSQEGSDFIVFKNELNEFAIAVDNPEVINILASKLNFESPIASGRAEVYAAAVKKGDEKVVEKLLELSLDDEPHKASECLAAITQTKDEKMFEFIVDYAKTKFRAAEFASVLVGLMRNQNLQKKTWEYINKEFTQLQQKIPSQIKRIISSFDVFSTKEALDEVKKFFESHKNDKLERTYQKIIEHIEYKIEWVSKNQEELRKFLES